MNSVSHGIKNRQVLKWYIVHLMLPFFQEAQSGIYDSLPTVVSSQAKVRLRDHDQPKATQRAYGVSGA